MNATETKADKMQLDPIFESSDGWWAVRSDGSYYGPCADANDINYNMREHEDSPGTRITTEATANVIAAKRAAAAKRRTR